jgi:hypothetical protein
MTMLMTLLAVTRAELGMVAMGRRSIRCGAGSGASPSFSGGCWPASPNVALAGVAASGREYAIRVRGRATTVVPEAATRAFPTNLAPTGYCPASPPTTSRAMLGSGHLCHLAGGLGPGPL